MKQNDTILTVNESDTTDFKLYRHGLIAQINETESEEINTVEYLIKSYKDKEIVHFSHNITLFDLTSKSVTCYFWNETAVDLSVSMFASCIVDFPKGLDLKGVTKVILHSDGCAYQNST
ncbi:hypothetical protein ACF0H5_002325 [Mactra antiquata]